MKKVKHIALFQFKDSTTPEQVTEIFRLIGGLREQIPGIADYSWGPNTSPEGLAQAYTHSLVMTFESAAARDAYVRHPAHQRVVQLGLPLVTALIVLDHDV